MGIGNWRRLIYDAFWKTERSFSSRSAHPQSFFQNVNVNVDKKSPFNLVAKRLYNTHIAKRQGWYENPLNLISLGFVGCVVAIPVYCWSLETVPYGKRGFFVLASLSLEKKIGEFNFERLKSEKYKGKILEWHQPESIRVKKILQEVIGGLRRKNEQAAELFDWEIIVVDDPTKVDAHSTSAGKIIVFTGLLRRFKTDAQIATFIGHHVGHVVARHIMEKQSVFLWHTIATVFMLIFFKKTSHLPRPLANSNFVVATKVIFPVVSLVFLNWFGCRWQQTEADYLGMLISASGGYDPRVAPQVYNTFRGNYKYPPGKKRAELLSRPKIMEEALAIYKEALNHKHNNTLWR